MSLSSLSLTVVAVYWAVSIATASVDIQQATFDMCGSCDGSSMPAEPDKELLTPSVIHCAWSCQTNVLCQAIRFNEGTKHCQLWNGPSPAVGNNYTVFVRN